jgi:hypothetical protein
MPKRPRSHVNEDLSRARLHEIFTRQGWTVEDLDKDYGEDLLVRIFVDGSATPWTFYVQAKSTDNIAKFLTRDGDALEYRLDEAHLTHWDKFWEPVLLSLWDSVTDKTYWEVIQTPERPLRFTKSGAPRLQIPLDNILNEQSVHWIARRTQARHQRFEMEQHGADVLLEQLKNALGVDVSYDSQAGILMIDKPEGGADVTLFGKRAEQMESLLEMTGMDGDEALEHAFRLLSQVSEAFMKGGHMFIQDKSGNTIQEFKDIREFLKYVDREEI